MNKYRNQIYIALIGLLIAFSNSCAPTTGASYLSENNKGEFNEIPDEIFYASDEIPDTIQINDQLYITVTKTDGEPNNFTQNTGAGSNVDLMTYIVDEEGYIKIPYLERIYVEGASVKEATEKIENELVQYIGNATVLIRVINHRYSVLGEVGSPGLYTFGQKSLNIYQAIATANDITLYGDRKNVLIVRQNGNRVVKKYINLLDENIITSQWYIIQPNDLIYVPPLGRKAFGMETVPIDLFFTLFSTTLTIFTFMITLINL